MYEVLLTRAFDLTVPKNYRVQVTRQIMAKGRQATANSNWLDLEITERP